jgi:hypothetical protein
MFSLSSWVLESLLGSDLLWLVVQFILLAFLRQFFLTVLTLYEPVSSQEGKGQDGREGP